MLEFLAGAASQPGGSGALEGHEDISCDGFNKSLPVRCNRLMGFQN